MSNPENVIPADISNRTAMAAQLAEEYDAVQKRIIEFMQADPDVKDKGWGGSPYSYLQYVLTRWAVKQLHR
jgi:hypothetical protein